MITIFWGLFIYFSECCCLVLMTMTTNRAVNFSDIPPNGYSYNTATDDVVGLKTTDVSPSIASSTA